MIWLIGKNGLLGSYVEKVLKHYKLFYKATGREVDITNYKALEHFVRGNKVEWIINCSGYTKVDMAEKEKNIAFQINCEGYKYCPMLF